MKGGARGRSGPPPDPNALRRDRAGDAASWITLPAEGRDGPPPAWPLSRATSRETALWESEWKRPQAVEWERNGQAVEVALYVRSLVGAEKANAAVGLRTLVKQQQEALGISLPGLARNRWIIPKTGEASDATVQAISSAASQRRLTVVASRADSA